MFSIGDSLKRARLKQGLDLSALSTRTKISATYLAAIESDDRNKLPGGFFYRSFVDQYARALSLDTTEIDAELNRMFASDAPLPLPGQDDNPIQRSVPITMRSRRRWPIIVVTGLIGAVFGSSAVYALWGDGRLPIQIPQVVARANAPVVEASRPPQSENSAPQSSQAEAVQLPLPASAVAETQPEPVAPAESIAEPARASDSEVSLEIVATEKTWLSVSSEGKPIYSGVLKPHQMKRIAGKRSAKLTVGNAGGLSVRLNGKRVGRLGAHGQVMVVLFTPNDFHIVSPSSKDGD